MRQIQRQFAFEWMLLAGLVSICRTAFAAPDGQLAAAGDRMDAIVAAVRAEEAKYPDIEYIARIVVRDSAHKDAADPAEVTTLAPRRVVLQGDRNYIRYQATNARRWPGFAGSCSPLTTVSARVRSPQTTV